MAATPKPVRTALKKAVRSESKLMENMEGKPYSKKEKKEAYGNMKAIHKKHK